MQPLNTTLSLIVFFGPVRHPVCLDSKMQPPSLLLVLLGLTLTQGKQEILEKQGNGYGLDDTQHHPSTLHSEETQGYNDAPVSNTLKCPRFQYFDCMKCVPLRNGDNGPLCACDGWIYYDFYKECRPTSGPPPPPGNCEADLQQCRNDMQRVQQELQNCRQNCGQKPSQPPPQQPGRFEYDRDGK